MCQYACGHTGELGEEGRKISLVPFSLFGVYRVSFHPAHSLTPLAAPARKCVAVCVCACACACVCVCVCVCLCVCFG
jgi:hypothetical protein